MSGHAYKWYLRDGEIDALEAATVSLLSFEERDLDPDTVARIHDKARSAKRNDRDLFVSIKLYTRPRLYSSSSENDEEDERKVKFAFEHQICAYYGEEKYLDDAIKAFKEKFEEDEISYYYDDFEEEHECLYKIEILCKSLPLRLEEMAFYVLFTRSKCLSDLRQLPKHKYHEFYRKYGLLWFAILI